MEKGCFKSSHVAEDGLRDVEKYFIHSNCHFFVEIRVPNAFTQICL